MFHLFLMGLSCDSVNLSFLSFLRLFFCYVVFWVSSRVSEVTKSLICVCWVCSSTYFVFGSVG